MIMQQMEGAGSNENGPRDASGKFLGNCRDGSLNDDNPSARDFRHPRCPPDTGAPEPQPDFITAGDRLVISIFGSAVADRAAPLISSNPADG